MKNTKTEEQTTEKQIRKEFDMVEEHPDNIDFIPLKNFKNAVIVTTQIKNTKPKDI